MRNSRGEDITSMVRAAAAAGGVTVTGLLALAIAESGLDPTAERWGRETAEAKAAIRRGDRATLDAIIGRSWPDISFGYSQRIVRFHDEGDQSSSVDNCLAVREAVFADPQADLTAAARRLRSCLDRTGDDLLRALVVYNSGGDNLHEDWYRQGYAGNIANYTAAIAKAADLAAAMAPADDAPLRALDALWGAAEQVGHLSPQMEADMKVWIVTVKDALLRP